MSACPESRRAPSQVSILDKERFAVDFLESSSHPCYGSFVLGWNLASWAYFLGKNKQEFEARQGR